MSQPIAMSVYEIVNSPLCVASDDGQKVYEQLAAALKQGHDVELSFRNVMSLTSAFLNTAIGQLYGGFSEESIRARLSIADMQGDDQILLKQVVDTAKLYFKDPKRFKTAVREVMGKEDEQ